MGSSHLSTALIETSNQEVDALLMRLSQHKQIWLTLPLEARLQQLATCLENVKAVSSEWAEAACAMKGLDPTMAIAGEEWIVGPFAIMRYLRLLIRTLTEEKKQVKKQVRRVRQRVSHSPSVAQNIVQVFPNTLFDRLLWLGTTAEVWVQPEHPLKIGQKDAEGAGEVGLVLGAGNISSISPLDVLHQLFVENRVALLKMNPVNAAIGPWLEKAFSGLQSAGFFAIAYGGADLGAHLCQHPAVDAIHITGAQQTHDAIVWGSASEQVQRKANRLPLLQKPITSELGGVTPIIVVPGQWSDREITFQARHVASMVAHNASFNCVAGKVLVLAKHWPQRSQFLDRVRQQLRKIPPRLAYYPGAQERYSRFLERYPASEVLGQSAEGCIPWTLIPNVSPTFGEYALTAEAFCGILAEVSLDAVDADDFLKRVPQFVNDCLYGTLSCTVLIDPKTQKRNRAAFEKTIAYLKYGTIGINIWSGALFVMPEIPWGAFPGNSLEAIGSGQGFVHNTELIQNPQKAVVSAPFYIWPTPVWFAQHRTLNQVGQRLVAFEYRPQIDTFAAVIAAAVRG
jgi:Aldehyde dehydrogenase family